MKSRRCPATPAPTTVGPAAHWTFDDGTGSSASDSSGNGNTGTLTNMEESDWVHGIMGSALAFDGVNEWVQAANSATASSMLS